MRSRFEDENNLALYDYLVNESEHSPEPYNPETCYLARYLYISRIDG